MRPAALAGREIWFQEARNIQGYPRIYHVYTSNDIPCISMDIPCIYFVDIPCISLDIHGISTQATMDIHGISKDIPCIYHTYTIHMDEDTICMLYTRHIPGIYQKLGFQMLVRTGTELFTKVRTSTYFSVSIAVHGSTWRYKAVHDKFYHGLWQYMTVHGSTSFILSRFMAVHGCTLQYMTGYPPAWGGRRLSFGALL